MKKIIGYILLLLVLIAITTGLIIIGYKQGGWHDVILSFGVTASVLVIVLLAIKLIENK